MVSESFHLFYFWCCGHEYVVRPPILYLLSGTPSLGHRPPGTRWFCRLPICEPPRLVSSEIVRVVWRSNLRISLSDRVFDWRRGSIELRHNISSVRRFPNPAIFDWSMSCAFIGRAECFNTSERAGTVISHRCLFQGYLGLDLPELPLVFSGL